IRVKFNSNAEEIRIITKDGSVIDVEIPETATKVQDIIDAINNDAQNGGKVTASINPQRTGLQLKDNTAGAGVLQVMAINNANTLMDLGFSNIVPINSASGQQDPISGDLIIGKRLISSLSSVLGRNLNGGSRLFEFDGIVVNDFTGVRNGNITITNKAGMSTNISLVGIPGVSSITVDPNIGDTILTLDNTENVSIGARIRIQEGAISEVKTVIGISGSTITLDSGLVNDFSTAARVFNENTVTAVGGGGTTISVDSVSDLAQGLKIIITNGATTQARYITNISGNTLTLDSPITLPVGSIVYPEKESLRDYIVTINDKLTSAGANVIATLNNQQTGINLVDSSGGTGNLAVSNLGTASTAGDLGINQTVQENILQGNSLSLQYINENTLLSTLNAGKGVSLGKFRITDSVGKIIDVDLSQGTVSNLFTVLDRINSAASTAGSSLRARINSTGNGILLVDLAGGSQKIKVTELENGSTARDLGILGEAKESNPDILDGSFKKKIDVLSTDTARMILDKLVALNLPVSISIVNDGTSMNPYRFSFLAKQSGIQNIFTVEKSGNISLQFQLQQVADNGILLFGTPEFPNVPFLSQTANNTVNDIVPGLSLNMRAVTSSPVTISVTRDVEGLVGQVQKLVDAFNSLVDKIEKHTISNPDTGEKGALAGDFQLKVLKNSIARVFQEPITGIPTSLINAGKEIGIEFLDTGKIFLNSSTLQDALTTKFDEVVNFFTISRKLENSVLLSDLNNGNGVRQIFGNDFKITRKDGVVLNIDIDNSKTVGQVLDLINFHPSNSDGKLKATISADGKNLVITDTTGGSGSLKVENMPNSFTATDLGIEQTVTGTTITGKTLNIKGANGLSPKIVEIIDNLVIGPNGFLTLKKDSVNDNISKNNEKIESLQKRIERQEAELIKQFAQLESLLAQSRSLQEALETTLQNFLQGLATFQRRR
ncbi:MAG: flagellar filament capping protein FliD, partial [Planctomycetota bacterium]